MKNNSGQTTADLSRVARLLVAGEFHRGTLGEGDAPNKLLIDYDGRPTKFHHLLRDCKRLGVSPRHVAYVSSNTRGHWHIIIYMREKMPLLARIFCQLWLGSDKFREASNFVRAYHYGRTDKYVQILFGRKLPYERISTTLPHKRTGKAKRDTQGRAEKR